MLGFDTTMKGRFRRAWMRCASRMGKRERVKLADENSASVERGGRPCLYHDK
jgi:methylphosphotriester-DNA--protein-cysteine methyltransferase